MALTTVSLKLRSVDLFKLDIIEMWADSSLVPIVNRSPTYLVSIHKANNPIISRWCHDEELLRFRQSTKRLKNDDEAIEGDPRFEMDTIAYIVKDCERDAPSISGHRVVFYLATLMTKDPFIARCAYAAEKEQKTRRA